METNSGKDLMMAFATARCVARNLRMTISDMERALRSVDALLEEANREPDAQKAAVLAAAAALNGYHVQKEFATTFVAEMKSGKGREEGSEE